jgi:hypothetical protein
VFLGWDQYCENKKEYGSSDHDLGSFGEGIVWDSKCVIPIPDGYSSSDAAPLMVNTISISYTFLIFTDHVFSAPEVPSGLFCLNMVSSPPTELE